MNKLIIGAKYSDINILQNILQHDSQITAINKNDITGNIEVYYNKFILKFEYNNSAYYLSALYKPSDEKEMQVLINNKLEEINFKYRTTYLSTTIYKNKNDVGFNIEFEF